MDINQFDWVMVKQKPGFWKGTLQRSVVLLPVFIGCSVLIVNFAYGGQRIFKKDELTIIFEGILLIFMGVFNSIWHVITQASPEKLVKYKVSSDGVSRDSKKISLNAFRNPAIEQLLQKNALPYQQWRKPSPPEVTEIKLTLPSNQGKMELLFPSEYERQKFIRTLQEYLHPTPVVELTNTPK